LNGCPYIASVRFSFWTLRRQAEWKPSPKTDADGECEFYYQPEGWSKPYRFVALRKEKPREPVAAEQPEQYQLFETSQYKYRVFVTDMKDPINFVVWFYGQRGGAENLIKEANNDAGLAAHPTGRFDVNGNHFQLAMLAFNRLSNRVRLQRSTRDTPRAFNRLDICWMRLYT